jgi:hypothetical protein
VRNPSEEAVSPVPDALLAQCVYISDESVIGCNASAHQCEGYIDFRSRRMTVWQMLSAIAEHFNIPV